MTAPESPPSTPPLDFAKAYEALNWLTCHINSHQMRDALRDIREAYAVAEAALSAVLGEPSPQESSARQLLQERDHLWCLCLLDEDVEVIQRITTRVNQRRTDNPMGLWPDINAEDYRVSSPGPEQEGT